MGPHALRRIVMGHKNWLFAGCDKGGPTAATLCSFIASCQRNAIDPFAYLCDVIARISACPTNDLDLFLPTHLRNAADQDTPMVLDSPPAGVQ